MAQGSHKMQRSMSVAQVVRHADEPFFDAFYSPKNWFRSADAMLKQASVYELEGDLQTAYFLLYRHAKLILDFLPKHPDAKDAQYAQSWLVARKAVQRSLAKLEILKPRINKRFERYRERADAANAAASGPGGSLAAEASAAASTPPPAPQLDPSENVGIAVELANARFGGRAGPDDDLTTALVNARRRIDQTQAATAPAPSSSSSSRSDTAFNYPAVAPAHASTGFAPAPPRSSSISSSQYSVAPRLPQESHRTPSSSPPPLPPKGPSVPAKVSSSSPSRPATPDPVQQFATASQLEDGTALRTVFLPQRLRASFLRLAAANTSRNLETLGLLCGALVRNAFFVTHLLVPPQRATSDTCEMTDAGETLLDAFVSAHSPPDGDAGPAAAAAAAPTPASLLVLGWIHTHPSQTCFLSSRDLHTHVWYQASLPEAVAIVCAPSVPPPAHWGAFRLTDPPGMRIVRSCTRPGIFHPHDEDTRGAGIYTDVVGRPGHVIEGDMPLEVVDLRE